jgi:hypothetical protein
MKRALLCTVLIAALLSSTAWAAEKNKKGNRREGRREAARKKSANTPRREGRRPRRTRDKGKSKARTDVLIYQFKHIHVDSFIDTLEQLARSKHVAPHLKDVPHAVNEQSNTMVMLAPPELTKLVRQIAEGVDKPNPREMRRREGMRRRRPGSERGRRMDHHGRGKHTKADRDDDENGKRTRRCPQCRKGGEQCKRDGKCPMGTARSRRQGRSRGHRGPMIGMLLHPRVANALKLKEGQIDRIEGVVEELHEKMEQMAKRTRSDGSKKGGKDRVNVRKRIDQLHKEAARDVARILTDDQKKQWESMRKKMVRGMHQRREGHRGKRDRDDDEDEDDEDRGRRRNRRRDRDDDDE